MGTEYDILGVDMGRSDYDKRRGYPFDPSRNIHQLQELFQKNAPPKQSEMMLDRDPGERNSQHPSVQNKNTRVVAYERTVGAGAVLYMGLGHMTVDFPGRAGYKRVWTNPAFEQLAKNAIGW